MLNVHTAVLFALLSTSLGSSSDACRIRPDPIPPVTKEDPPNPTPPVEEEEDDPPVPPEDTGFNLALAIASEQVVVAPGSRIVFTVSLQNTGPAPASAATVSATLPTGTTFDSNGSTFTCVATACSASLGAIAKDASGSATLAVITDEGFRGNAHLTAVNTTPGDTSANDDSAALDVPVSLRALDEHFDDATSLSRLQDVFATLHSTYAIEDGRLVLAPVAQQYTHWYEDNHAPFVAKRITGNFVAEVNVRVSRNSNRLLAPQPSFNAAGFVARDPASTPNNERWVMYNIGNQVGTMAREVKSTRPHNGSTISTLYLNNTTYTQTTLRLCRVGDTFHFFHSEGGAFVEEPSGASPQGTANPQPPGITASNLRFQRVDMPAAIDVGLIAGVWDGSYDLRGEFDDLRFGDVSALADCTQTF